MQQLVSQETVWIIYDGSTERNVTPDIKDIKLVFVEAKVAVDHDAGAYPSV